MQDTASLQDKVCLITGGAQRIGAHIASLLHAHGMRLLIHYRNSSQQAIELQTKLNAMRPDSVCIMQADLCELTNLQALIERVQSQFGRLDVLINNASSFYPTAIGDVTEEQWNDLLCSNLKAPFFLSQYAAPLLKISNGCIINMVDIHAERPLKEHPVYCSAKAGLVMLTKSLARELGPEVRVNAIAPGAILWPETSMTEETKASILARIALKRQGNPDNIAQAALFLIANAGYTTGQIITVDGGRSLHC